MDESDRLMSEEFRQLFRKCVASGLDPVQVMSEAIGKKERIDAFIIEALNPDNCCAMS